MRILIQFFVLFLNVFFFYTPVLANDTVGVLPGSFEVTPLGAAVYSIPIDIPPGLNSHQPTLSLVYSSQERHGAYDKGWNVSGASAIYRCTATLVDNNAVDSVDYDDNDQFCFDGKRLILAGGVHLSDGAIYRKQIDDHTHIEAFGSSGLGDGAGGGWLDWFAVELSDASAFNSDLWLSETSLHMYNGVAPGTYSHIPGDFNGDGVMDVATLSPKALGGWEQWFSVDLSNFGEPDLMTSITPPIGSEFEIEYEALTKTSQYQQLSGSQYPVQEITVPIHVVTAANKLTNYTVTGEKIWKRFEHSYKGLRANIQNGWETENPDGCKGANYRNAI